MRILVILGTKAQYIKMAPILRQLDASGIDYRLVYTGQHSETFDILEKAFGTRPADDILIPDFEAATKRSFAGWAARVWIQILRRLWQKEWWEMDICLVHGDTVSTLFGAMAARMGGIRVGHIEAGLRSTRLFDPFPEEIIRRVVSTMTHLHFCPDASASMNLSGSKGEIVETGGNSLRDALNSSLQQISPPVTLGGSGGYGVVSIHRNENLSNTADFDLLMSAVMMAATTLPIKFVLHPATRAKLASSGWRKRLDEAPGLELMDRVDYPDFIKLLIGSSLLMTDGGSNQEEAAMLGLPTLLLRRATERPDGIGHTIELSHLQPKLIQQFVDQHAGHTWKVNPTIPGSPSALVVQALQDRFA